MSSYGMAEATRIVPASAADIFDLLATPAKHPLIDGSHTVLSAQSRTPERLSAGAKFGMNMKLGGRYKILNHVVEFEEGRRIAWRHFGGHIWRYILEPVGKNSTVVTEQFDPRAARSPIVLKIIRATPRNQKAIDKTLNRLVEWASSR
jgi:hypothetical protein